MTSKPAPVLAVTTGEPAGVGPELCLQMAGRDFGARLVLVGDGDLLAERAAGLGKAVPRTRCCGP